MTQASQNHIKALPSGCLKENSFSLHTDCNYGKNEEMRCYVGANNPRYIYFDRLNHPCTKSSEFSRGQLKCADNVSAWPMKYEALPCMSCCHIKITNIYIIHGKTQGNL